MVDIQQTVEEILRRECRVEGPVTPATRLSEDLRLDSLGFLTLAVALENHYLVVLGEPPDEPPATVQDLVDLVALRLAEAGR